MWELTQSRFYSLTSKMWELLQIKVLQPKSKNVGTNTQVEILQLKSKNVGTITNQDFTA